MRRTFCKSKIHRATVTGADLEYEGSITLDADLLDVADIREYERVQVVNLSNGERLETYTIAGERGSGAVVLNGAAARKVAVGDEVIIISYGIYDDAESHGHRPRAIFVDAGNRIISGGTNAGESLEAALGAPES